MRRPALVLSCLVVVVATASAAVDLTISWSIRTSPIALLEDMGYTVFSLAFAVVGALIVARRPGQVVGWLCAIVGVSFSLNSAAASYAQHHFAMGGSSTLGLWSGWAATWLWSPGFVCGFLLLPLLFPDGRLPSRRWRAYVAFTLLVATAQLVGLFFLAGPMELGEQTVWANPFGIPTLAPLIAVVDRVMELAFLPLLGLMVAAVVLRYRRARADERHQLKWFLWGVTLVAAGFLYSLTPLYDVLSLPQVAMFLVLPASIGIAVARYRLYEIDRIVSRTVSYAVVTGVLVATYAGAVVLLGRVLAPVTQGSDVAVAGSTLLVAALFQPLRRRVQRAVDHRFNRSRYDAQRIVEDFAAGLRDEVLLDDVHERLLGAVSTTVAPIGASLWLREGGP